MDHRALVDLGIETYDRLADHADEKTCVTAVVEAVLARTDRVIKDLEDTLAGVRMENERLSLMLDQANARARGGEQLAASA